MKKLLLASVLIFALGCILSSCSSHANCAAYSKADAKVEKVQKNS